MIMINQDLFKSNLETCKHKNEVLKNMNIIAEDLHRRAISHDNSKLEEPECSGYAFYTKKLAGLTYGSEEYTKSLQQMKPTIDHHYANNSHHPEHYIDGILNMNLVEIIEMLCDWVAACKRHDDGNIYESIEINQKRFGYSDELKQIFINTVRTYLEVK